MQAVQGKQSRLYALRAWLVEEVSKASPYASSEQLWAAFQRMYPDHSYAQFRGSLELVRASGFVRELKPYGKSVYVTMERYEKLAGGASVASS